MLQPHVAEVWRLTYVTPPPTSPRTFVVLLLSRELVTEEGKRSFMNSESILGGSFTFVSLGASCIIERVCDKLEAVTGQPLSLDLEGDTVTLTAVSIPFAHPSCIEKQGAEKSRVRGKYVSVERVTEKAGGQEVEWRMTTSSDAGGKSCFFSYLLSIPLEEVAAYTRQHTPLRDERFLARQHL